jgi:trans-aconitate 2-methyltransferase
VTVWDPTQYRRFQDERSRPFYDLLAVVDATQPRLVVDLGCGPGPLTASLVERWPGAQVIGVDSSSEMIAAASTLAAPEGLRFELGDVRSWEPPGPVDVLVTNAALQWVPGHRHLLGRFASWLSAGGTLAMQVPGNFDAPSHRLLGELTRSERWAAKLAGIEDRRAAVDQPADYLTTLVDAGLRPTVWETTYFQILHGPDPVLEWMKGTALRPVLSTLGPEDAMAFQGELAVALGEAYPPQPLGTVLPFRRIFAVGRK